MNEMEHLRNWVSAALKEEQAFQIAFLENRLSDAREHKGQKDIACTYVTAAIHVGTLPETTEVNHLLRVYNLFVLHSNT